MGPRIGVPSPSTFQEESGNSAERDGTTISILTSRKISGVKMKTGNSYRLKRSRWKIILVMEIDGLSSAKCFQAGLITQ